MSCHITYNCNSFLIDNTERIDTPVLFITVFLITTVEPISM